MGRRVICMSYSRKYLRIIQVLAIVVKVEPECVVLAISLPW